MAASFTARKASVASSQTHMGKGLRSKTGSKPVWLSMGLDMSLKRKLIEAVLRPVSGPLGEVLRSPGKVRCGRGFRSGNGAVLEVPKRLRFIAFESTVPVRYGRGVNSAVE